MPPGIVIVGGGPSKPWKISLNVLHMTPLNESSQKLKLELKLLSASALCRHGGTFAIMHARLSGKAVQLYTVTLPKQPPTDDDAMRNYSFVAQVNIDLTLGKEFRVEWFTLASDGSVVPRDPLLYPAKNVHP